MQAKNPSQNKNNQSIQSENELLQTLETQASNFQSTIKTHKKNKT